MNFGAPNFDIEDYSFVNFAAEYEINSHFLIFARVDNLTNEHYSEVFGFPRAGTRGLRRSEAAILVAARRLVAAKRFPAARVVRNNCLARQGRRALPLVIPSEVEESHE